MAKFSTHCMPYILPLLFHFYTIVISTNPSAILYDLSPFIRVYTNGTIERLMGTEIIPASIDKITGVQSKDIVISRATNVSARLYIPEYVCIRKRLPLAVYFHGGAFFTASSADPSYHKHMNTIVVKANVIVVSVNYKLAPEHPLPTGYNDSWVALKWVFSHRQGRGTEPWLNSYADFRHVYLSGDSAGANIAHNMAIWAGLDKGQSIVLDGMFMNCPHFWGEKPIGDEMDPKKGTLASLMVNIWRNAYPSSKSLDDPSLNPASDPNLHKLGCKRVVIVVAEADILKDRGLYYNRTLTRSGWKRNVKALEFKGEEHVFGLRFPERPNSIAMLNEFVSFVNGGNI